MLIKRTERQARRGTLASALAGPTQGQLDRRSFLRRSGLTVGGLAAVGALPLATVRKADAAGSMATAGATIRKNICTHCSVGCTVIAEVVNGVWVGQEPGWDSPINRGSHCAKGAATRELVHGDRRLRYPMKLVNGQWTRISWDVAINEIGDKLMEIRGKSGADSVYWLGSAKFTNEGSYLNRKLAAFWGTNNSDHQARICHSTTVAGVANTWGYGAMTNSYTDIRNAKTMIIMGGNPAEAHPVSLQHLLEGKETQRANMIVIDPRMTRTAAHATEYVRIRSGTDIPVIWGMLWHIFKNGWEDKQFIEQRVYGMDDIRKEVEKYTPEEVERISGVPGAQLERVAKMFATEKPATLIWCMGATQHTVGTANVRAFCVALLATGNVGAPGTGANIFRGHTNVQGATDLGLDIVTLPLYYGLVEGAWRHWSRVWEVDYQWFVDRFDKITGPDGKETNTMNTPGIPSTRWFDATLYDKKDVKQKDNIKAMFVMGHGGNTVTRMPQAQKGIETLDLLVVSDPHPTTWAALAPERKNGTYLLPIATSYETAGSRTASNRALQWGEQIVKPIFESKDDNEVMYLLAKKLGFADLMFKNIKVENNVPSPEDLLREINRGGWSTGYCGQSPERLKSHMANQKDFDMLHPEGHHRAEQGRLLRPALAVLGHAGVQASGHAAALQHQPLDQGGRRHLPRPLRRRARGNAARRQQAQGQPARQRLLLQGFRDQGRLSGVHAGRAQEARLGQGPHRSRAGGDRPDRSRPDKSGFGVVVDRPVGRHPARRRSSTAASRYGNGKARANAFGLPDAIPTHREPIYTPKPELVAKYPTLPNAVQFRMPNVGFDVQKAAVDKGIAKNFPLILTSGRLVEYEGGGEETRSNKWLAELQQDMFIEINPADATERGIKDGGWVWVTGAELDSKARMKALVTERVGKGVTWCPFHFAGWFQGVDQRGNYPKGTDPIVLGESVNGLTTYGFDPVTGMQEPKATLCQVRAA